jgi:hypothetical protein
MPLPPDVNLDTVSAFVVDHTRLAILEWKKGAPQDETSLMNHLRHCKEINAPFK